MASWPDAQEILHVERYSSMLLSSRRCSSQAVEAWVTAMTVATFCPSGADARDGRRVPPGILVKMPSYDSEREEHADVHTQGRAMKQLASPLPKGPGHDKKD